MQLLKVEGRQEYDYILLLDTEGCAPEFEGSEKRDNQMVTLSFLLADATIVVIPGENDAAIKDILPVVLMAYQASKLVEKNGGRRSSMLFFATEKLGTIVETLGTSLHEAFNRMHSFNGQPDQSTNEDFFRSFKLGLANSPQSDVCIVGNRKEKLESPRDVPDADVGETLLKFREHIHQRGAYGRTWRSRSILEFSSCVYQVWTGVYISIGNYYTRIIFDRLRSYIFI